ncbi:MAG: hypothetical protein ACI4T5_09600 [Prevotella sp.]
MKKIIVLALAVLLGAGTMSAQRGGGRQRMSVENRVEQMAKELDLTADQQKKILAIYKDAESKRKEGDRPTREQMRAEFEKLDQQVTAVLTKTQQKKYEEQKQARQNRRKQQ